MRHIFKENRTAQIAAETTLIALIVFIAAFVAWAIVKIDSQERTIVKIRHELRIERRTINACKRRVLLLGHHPHPPG